MLKGFVVVFTGFISYIYFNRRYTKLQFLGIGFVVLGLGLVGFSNVNSYNRHFAPNPLLGNILCLIGQFFLAGMFVYEEKILKEYDIHVFDIVGWEGVWGILISSIFLSIFFLIPGIITFIPGHDFGSYENPIQASQQVAHNYILLLSLLTSIFVIGPFNYYGTSLTKYSSAMHRCLIDASRMCVVWVISIICKWEHFNAYQGLGYLIILIGNLIYYEVINIDCFKENNGENAQLPSEQPKSCMEWMFPICCKKSEKSNEKKKLDEEAAVKSTTTDIEDSTNLLNKNKDIKN